MMYGGIKRRYGLQIKDNTKGKKKLFGLVTDSIKNMTNDNYDVGYDIWLELEEINKPWFGWFIYYKI